MLWKALRDIAIIYLNLQMSLTLVYAGKSHITEVWMAHHYKLASGLAWASGFTFDLPH